jgi:hypothetical protein
MAAPLHNNGNHVPDGTRGQLPENKSIYRYGTLGLANRRVLNPRQKHSWPAGDYSPIIRKLFSDYGKQSGTRD